MSNIIEFVSRNQLSSGQRRPGSLSTTDSDTEIQQTLARELKKLTAAMNLLEALRDRLSEEVASG
jgi:hypothetical protein